MRLGDTLMLGDKMAHSRRSSSFQRWCWGGGRALCSNLIILSVIILCTVALSTQKRKYVNRGVHTLLAVQCITCREGTDVDAGGGVAVRCKQCANCRNNTHQITEADNEDYYT